MKTSNYKHILSALSVLAFIFIATGSEDESVVEADIQNVTPEIEVSARKLYSDYESNGVAADQKYKGKVLRVTGIVKNIDRDILDQIYVTLKGDEYIGSVQCFLAENHSNKVAQLVQGERITVKGLCDGKLMNVFLRGCVIE